VHANWRGCSRSMGVEPDNERAQANTETQFFDMANGFRRRRASILRNTGALPSYVRSFYLFQGS
jgi:hypothetical protein